MIRINIKPMSLNQAWQGRRFKTKEYKKYEKESALRLPKKMDIPDGPLEIFFNFGMSNTVADYDNPIKLIQDIISRRYGFNDARIVTGHIKKIKVKKGQEFVEFKIIKAKNTNGFKY